MKKSYTILILVIVLGAIGILLITTANFLGIDAAKNSVARKNSAIGYYLSTTCAEYALSRIDSNSNLTTPLRNNVPQWVRLTVNASLGYYCQYQIINKTVPKIIKARSETQNFPHNLELTVGAVDPKIIISSWQEK